jgi:hypothetical protein
VPAFYRDALLDKPAVALESSLFNGLSITSIQRHGTCIVAETRIDVIPLRVDPSAGPANSPQPAAFAAKIAARGLYLSFFWTSLVN